jgi:hypothetical protein
MLRVDLRYIPPEWTIRSAFRHWPAQKQAAVLWVSAHAHLVHYRLQVQRRLSLLDFLRPAWWKLHHQVRRPLVTGRYLDVIDWP